MMMMMCATMNRDVFRADDDDDLDYDWIRDVDIDWSMFFQVLLLLLLLLRRRRLEVVVVFFVVFFPNRPSVARRESRGYVDEPTFPQTSTFLSSSP